MDQILETHSWSVWPTEPTRGFATREFFHPDQRASKSREETAIATVGKLISILHLVAGPRTRNVMMMSQSKKKRFLQFWDQSSDVSPVESNKYDQNFHLKDISCTFSYITKITKGTAGI